MMYCQRCKKNIATVHFTEIADYAVKQETHVCEACAQALELTGPAAKTVQPLEIVQTILKQSSLPDELRTVLTARCDTCGMTYAEFRAGGRLGCPDDYAVFADGIRVVLDQVQGGATKHTGKVPRRGGALIELRRLRASLEGELAEAIAVENYERAAQLRDEINQVDTDLARRGADVDAPE